jgi:hypothetical protein
MRGLKSHATFWSSLSRLQSSAGAKFHGWEAGRGERALAASLTIHRTSRWDFFSARRRLMAAVYPVCPFRSKGKAKTLATDGAESAEEGGKKRRTPRDRLPRSLSGPFSFRGLRRLPWRRFFVCSARKKVDHGWAPDVHRWEAGRGRIALDEAAISSGARQFIVSSLTRLAIGAGSLGDAWLEEPRLPSGRRYRD